MSYGSETPEETTTTDAESAGTPTTAESIADQEAKLAELKQQAAIEAEAAEAQPATLESLDARVTELERHHKGGAKE